MANQYFPVPDMMANGWKPEGFLGGMLYAKDRARYEDRANLYDLVQQMATAQQGAVMEDYKLDAPVRAQKRLGDIQTDLGRQLYAVPQAGANLDQTITSTDANRVATEFNRKTMGSRVRQSENTANEGELKNARDGMTAAMEFMSVLEQSPAAGPGSAAVAQQYLATVPDHIKRNPVFQHILSGGDLGAMSQRLAQMQQRLSVPFQQSAADNASREKVAAGNNAAQVAAAQARTGAERDGSRRANAYYNMLKLQNPNMPEELLRGQAQIMADSGQWGAGKPIDTAANKALVDTTKDALNTKRMFQTILKDNDPRKAALTGEIRALEEQLRNLGVNPATVAPAEGSAAGKAGIPPGIPAGSTKIGRTPDGRDVWKAPNGETHVADR